MKGLEWSQQFYLSYGEPMLKEQFPEEASQIAVGLFGMGSECWGFDDEWSQDHDFEPRFYLFLGEEQERKFGFRLMRAYDRLVKEHGRKSPHSLYGGHRGGVVTVEEFFSDLIGSPRPPRTPEEWMWIPEEALSAATNGKIFADPVGRVTAFRAALLDRPEDVRLKKMAARLGFMAQSGQYNYRRCCRRGEFGAAHLAADEFVRQAAELVFLLDRVYAPHEKWLFYALRKLPGRRALCDRLEAVLQGSEQNWKEKEEQMEELCGIFAAELRRDGLSDASDAFLEAHAVSVFGRVRDAALQGMHLLEG